MASNVVRYALGAIAALAVAGAAYFGLRQEPAPEVQADVNTSEPVEQEQAESAAVVEDTPTDVAEAETDVSDDPAPAEEALELSESAPEEPVEEEVVAMAPPTLDVFRVDPDGLTTLAGQAQPGVSLDVLVAGAAMERLEADAQGKFVGFLSLEPSDVSRTLSVVADPDGEAVAMVATYFIEPFGIEEQKEADVEAPLIAGAVAPVEDVIAEAVESVDESVEAVIEDAEVALADVVADTEEAVVETIADAGSEVVASSDTAVELSEASEATKMADSAVETELTPEIEAAEEEVVALAEAVSEEPAASAAENEVALEDEVAAAVEEIVDTDQTETSTSVADAVDTSEQAPNTSDDDAMVVSETSAPTDLEQEGQADETEQAIAPRVLVADEEGVRIVATGPAPELNQIALDTITYDLEGEVLLAGRASTDGFVQVYIDNQPVTTSRIAADRNWRTDLPEVDTGIYTLRIDELDADGNVVSRIETPFKREEPEVVAAVMADETERENFDVAVKTVQPGATLWAIAREKYGEGILYVAVYEANADQIRDPDLIYPGQVFVLPEVAE